MGLALIPVEKLPLGKRILRLGTRGRDVGELQKILIELGFLNISRRGEYDYATEEAVKNFQCAFHLSVDGRVGPKTLWMLKEPAVWNRRCYCLGKAENMKELAARYGVSPRAWKDPSGRRSVKHASPGDRLLLEKRELWLAQEEILPKNREFCSQLLQKSLPAGGYNVFPLLPPFFSEEEKQKKKQKAAGIVVDLRNAGWISVKQRKKLILFRKQVNAKVFWWLSSGGKKRPDLPETTEADGVIFTPAVGGNETRIQDAWRRETLKLLDRYACTRLILHFDLRGKEWLSTGETRLLSPGEGRTIRRSRPGRLQRLEEYGWLMYQYRCPEEEKKILIPDGITVRGIFYNIDRLNLRGVFFTGIRGLETVIAKESSRFFLVFPGSGHEVKNVRIIME